MTEHDRRRHPQPLDAGGEVIAGIEQFAEHDDPLVFLLDVDDRALTRPTTTTEVGPSLRRHATPNPGRVAHAHLLDQGLLQAAHPHRAFGADRFADAPADGVEPFREPPRQRLAQATGPLDPRHRHRDGRDPFEHRHRQ